MTVAPSCVCQIVSEGWRSLTKSLACLEPFAILKKCCRHSASCKDCVIQSFTPVSSSGISNINEADVLSLLGCALAACCFSSVWASVRTRQKSGSGTCTTSSTIRYRKVAEVAECPSLHFDTWNRYRASWLL
eukprot:Blabericola_migrator_1__870@NODE_1213_length_5100_cov_46_971985_g823_i0_p4_GENE_NODE_1213_length_5100_cov_46_971985_g823_i0NODE_1213_length_5100_cov_46_971985_g823_i0_p4_ORF_typecomplete_len132_score4_51DUF3433/PF11915_8/0_047_NODE_1213_length_5100_cov_46_971985_g823_i0366761